MRNFLSVSLIGLLFSQLSFATFVGKPVKTVNGGTQAATLTAHGVVLGNGASAVNVTSAGTAGQILTSNGSSADPTFQAAAAASPVPPASISITATGSGTFNEPYAFIITSGNATAAATYTNNSITYTVLYTVSGATLVYMTGSNVPLSSGTLTKASGTGDSTLTFSAYKAPLYLKVTAVAGGGGGSGQSASAGVAGSNGNDTTFGSSLLTASHGSGGPTNTGGNSGGNGGTCTIASPAIPMRTITGGPGGGGAVSALSIPGAFGGSNPLGGAGSTPGGAGALVSPSSTNTGAGGPGAGGSAGSVILPGTGGGAGCYLEAELTNPSATYSYVNGAGGAAGTGTSPGGAGADGRIDIFAAYQ